MLSRQFNGELAAAGGVYSRVVALLHSKACTTEIYLKICYRSGDAAGGCLTISPEHLLRVREGGASSQSFAATGWDWMPAENVRPGDQLEYDNGQPVVVQSVSRACCVGAFAPLTVCGQLLVDGVLCSCYAPPAAWEVPHSACHTAMLPLRFLDTTKQAVEHWTRFEGAKDPLLTVDALWLLPSTDDASMHPWASGLLQTAGIARDLAQQCKKLVPAETRSPQPQITK